MSRHWRTTTPSSFSARKAALTAGATLGTVLAVVVAAALGR
jgi:hypothetical protein